jgi:hypothetical protein
MAELDTYWQGTRVRIYNTVTQADGVTPVTTAVLTVTVTLGLGTDAETVLAPGVNNAGAGDYYVDVTLSVPGVCVHDWVCSAPVIVADEDRLYVRRLQSYGA